MKVTTNDILICVSLVERSLVFMNESTREPIRKSTLIQIGGLLTNATSKFSPYGRDVLILVPISEVIQLIKVMTSDESFVETDNESKKTIISKVQSALASLYLFAGKFYMNNDFNYSMGLGDILKRIVDNCVAAGYYFGYDDLLKAEGAID